jgi:hypothetical protein
MPLLVEFALAALKIALNRRNLKVLMPLISGNWVLLIYGLACLRRRSGMKIGLAGHDGFKKAA